MENRNRTDRRQKKKIGEMVQASETVQMEAGSVALDRTVLTNDGRIEVESNKIVESNQRIDRLVQDTIHDLIVLGSATTPEMEGRDGTIGI